MATGLTNGLLSLPVPGIMVNPAFFAYKSALTSNVTGDGTAYIAIFDSELSDRTSAYDVSTGIFTAQYTGDYAFGCALDVTGVGVAHNACEILLVTTSKTFYGIYCNPYVIYAGAVVLPCFLPSIPLTVGQTAKISLSVMNGTKVVGLSGTSGSLFTWFSGNLINRTV